MAEWLVERLSEDRLTMVGIDHAFSFPLRYFETYHLLQIGRPSSMTFRSTGPPMMTILCQLYPGWPPRQGRGSFREYALAASGGRAGRRQVGLSLRRTGLGGQVHPCRPAMAALHEAAAWQTSSFLALRRLESPACRSVIAEVYPSLWSKRFERKGELPTSTMPIRSQRGCAVRIWMAALRDFRTVSDSV